MVFAIIAALFFLTTAVGIPIAFSTGLAAVGGILATGGIQLNVLVIRTLKALDSFPLMAVPFFVLAGEVMARGQVTERRAGFRKSSSEGFRAVWPKPPLLPARSLRALPGHPRRTRPPLDRSCSPP